jgi:hypothetical protein
MLIADESFVTRCTHPGGSGKAEGFADGGRANHW